MTLVRAAALALVGALAVTACGGDSLPDSQVGSTTTTDTGSGTATDQDSDDDELPPVGIEGGVAVESLDGVVLARALLQAEDLPGYETRVEVRRFDSTEREGLLLCGRDLRADEGLTDGVQSVLVDDDQQVTSTVTAADPVMTEGFVEAFREAAEGCVGPWSQPASRLGEESLEATILGAADIGEFDVPVSAVRLQTTSDAGSSEVVIAVASVGPVLTTVTAAGPVDAELTVAGDAMAAVVQRAVALVEQLG